MNESVARLIAIEINNHLMNSPREFPSGPVDAIICGDGTRLSVQAGEYHHCQPRSSQGPWTHVEIMSDCDATYFEVDDSNIAGYVPIEDVAKEILLRGNWKLTSP